MFGRGQSKALQGALLVDRINTLAEDTRLANGFVEKDIGNFSINGRVLTYKFTAEGRPQIYAGGHKYTPLSGSYSVTLPATADRGYYIYFNVEDNSLEYQAGDPEVTNKRALLAWAYVGLDSQIIWYARETHGAGRNLDWHEAQHKNAGAIWRSGGILDVAPNRVVTISTPIVIADEDLVQVIGAGQELNQNLTMVDLPTLYWKGSAWDISTSFFMESFWDNRQTSSLARVPNGKFSVAFILFTDNIAHPVVRVYANDYYDSADEAREASVDLIGLPMPELVPAWKVVMDSSNVVRYIDKIVSRVGGLVEMGVGGLSDHDDLLGKDKANQHPISSITNLQTNLNNKLTRSSNLSDLTNTTTARNNLGLKGLATMNLSDLSFAATNHTHTIASTTGTLALNRGGTGATTAAKARSNLGLKGLATMDPSDLSFAATNHTHTLSSLSGTLPVNRGGTGGTTVATARSNLGYRIEATNMSKVYVGASETYKNLPDAIRAISSTYFFYGNDYIDNTAGRRGVEIVLRSGYVLKDQYLQRAGDLSWITISSEDTVVPVEGSSISARFPAEVGQDTRGRGGVFMGIGPSTVLPTINTQFHATGELPLLTDGILLANGAGIRIMNGGFRNCRYDHHTTGLRLYVGWVLMGTENALAGDIPRVFDFSGCSGASIHFVCSTMIVHSSSWEADRTGQLVRLLTDRRAIGSTSDREGLSIGREGQNNIHISRYVQHSIDPSEFPSGFWRGNTVNIPSESIAPLVFGEAIDKGLKGVAIGFYSQTTGSGVSVGEGAKSSEGGVAIGAYANTTHNYSVALGYYTSTNANRQIQIGRASGANMPTTIHSAVAITTRSDERDKADIKDTELGLDFIKALRPVQWRWDYRGDYLPDYPENFHEWEKDAQKEWKERHNIQNVKPEDKDGSKKRTRFHNGFIAQDVKQAMDELGVDFAGYQDASVQGCSDGDVRGLVYEQFIAPMVKAIQEQQEIIDNLTTRLSKLEGGK